MPDPIFTEYRRELVAKTLFDLLKIAVAAAFASMVLLARNLRHLAAKFPEALV